MTRPEDAAARAELERQAVQNVNLSVSDWPEDGHVFVDGEINLAALVDAVLRAQWRPIAELEPIPDLVVEFWKRDHTINGWHPYPLGGWTIACDLGHHEVWTPAMAVASFAEQGVTHFRIPAPPPKEPTTA